MKGQSRSLQACAECRRAKLRCDGLFSADATCSRCRKRGTECTWPSGTPEQIASTSSRRISIQADDSHFDQQSESPNASLSLDSQFKSGQNDPRNQWLSSDPSLSNTSTSRSSHTTSEDDPSTSNQYKRFRTHPAPMVLLREQMSTTAQDTCVGALAPDRQDEILTSEYAMRKREDVAEVNTMQALLLQLNWTRLQMQSLDMERKFFFNQVTASEPDTLREFDPVETGLLDHEDVTRLIGIYYTAINTQQGLSDPASETPRVIRLTSRAFFTAVLTVSASIDVHPRSRERRTTLYQYLDKTIELLLSSNAKSPAIVKTFLLAYLFSQKPNSLAEDRCWTLVDTATRVAGEIGLGQTIRKQKVSHVHPEHANRCGDRAWVFSLAAQRSLGTMSGIWPTTPLDVSWPHLEAWADSPEATYGDVQLAAYLSLRNLESNVRLQIESVHESKYITLESVRINCNGLFDSWRNKWVDHHKLADENFSRAYLLTVGLHVQLLLNITILTVDHEHIYPRAFDERKRVVAHNETVGMAIGLCKHFVDSFQDRTHQFARHFAGMITWSSIAMLQLRRGSGWTLATRIALMLAGDANDLDKRRSYSCFYGRLLLSYIHKYVDLNLGDHDQNLDGSMLATFPESDLSSSGLTSINDPQTSRPWYERNLFQEGTNADVTATFLPETQNSVMETLEADLLNASWLSQFFGTSENPDFS